MRRNSQGRTLQFTSYTLVYQLHSSLLVTLQFNSYTLVYQLHSCLLVTLQFTSYTLVYQLHSSLLVTLQFTSYTLVYQLHSSLLVTLQFTCYTLVYQLHSSLLVILQFTSYTLVYQLQVYVPVKSFIVRENDISRIISSKESSSKLFYFCFAISFRSFDMSCQNLAFSGSTKFATRASKNIISITTLTKVSPLKW